MTTDLLIPAGYVLALVDVCKQWRIDEDLLFARLGTRAHADLVVVTG